MKKLNNQRGASLMLALLLLMVATMVSTVILTAVASVSKHIKNDRETQQEYLNVISAAELLRDEILKSKYERVETKTYERTDSSKDEWTYRDTVKSETSAGEMGLMGQWLASCIDSDSGELKDFSDDFITIDVWNGTSKAIETVYASFRIEIGSTAGAEDSSTQTTYFDIIISLTNKNPKESDMNPEIDDCRMTLTLKGESTTILSSIVSENQLVKEEKNTTTVEFNSAEITKGAES